MRVSAAILAAGTSTRLGFDKTTLQLGDRPVWRWSYDVFSHHPEVTTTFVVASDGNLASVDAPVILGGSSRQESAARALDHSEGADILLLHDAARPFVSAAVISRVIEAVLRSGAAAAAVPVVDTIKEVAGGQIRTLDRSKLVAMQTPQGARVELLKRAHAASPEQMTDDMALLESIGVKPEIVLGDYGNFKITTQEDLGRARAVAGGGETRVGLVYPGMGQGAEGIGHVAGGGETRVGFGYDVHPFSDDPSRKLMLGGVEFPGHRALDGHSDADVVIHAAVDALLGAAGLGDIGIHFPNTEARWRGEPSATFLRAAADMLAAAGWQVQNLDVTVVAEAPKISARSEGMRCAIAACLGLAPDRVSIKATTNERLGFVGRGEGIAAMAIANLRQM